MPSPIQIWSTPLITGHVGDFVGLVHRLVWKVLFGEMRSLNDYSGLGSVFLVSATL